MKIRPVETSDYSDIADIYNYYVRNSNAAFPEKEVDVKFVESLHQSVLPGSFLVLDNSHKVVGFCCLKPFLALANFSRTASITYFIAAEYTGSGLGTQLFDKIIHYAEKNNIDNLIAVIASDNVQSIGFHRKQGFQLCGTFNHVGIKNNSDLSIIYMQKYLK